MGLIKHLHHQNFVKFAKLKCGENFMQQGSHFFNLVLNAIKHIVINKELALLHEAIILCPCLWLPWNTC